MAKKKLKKLYRSKKKRMIAGVCGGLGEYMNVDPTVVRVVFVAVSFLTGIIIGVLSYILFWIIVPER